MSFSVSGLRHGKLTTLLTIFILLFAVKHGKAQNPKPNVIFILADDVGYEIPTVNGGRSYSTPHIDYLAEHGMNFKHCESTPLCSPSRIMLLTGKYNFRNYSIWGWMNNGEKTVGNLMKDAGYATGWFGKLQLYSHDSDMHSMGFDNYVIFEALDFINGSRYKSPMMYKTGGSVIDTNLTRNKYADDILTDSIFNFIDRNKSRPFFAYYSMSLAHAPFSPTPDDAAFRTWDPSPTNIDTSFFPSMIKYMDKKVGQIIKKLKDENLDNNTIIVFCGDNGTSKGIVSQFNDEDYIGEKSVTTEAGTHVPLMVYWPGHITGGSTNDNLVDFNDFFPTLKDISWPQNPNDYGIKDGTSFYPSLLGGENKPKDFVFCHFEPLPNYAQTVSRWVQTKTYKLYDKIAHPNSRKFYNIVKDRNELTPLPDSVLTEDEKLVKRYLQSVLDTMPKAPAFPKLDSVFIKDITSSSVTVGASVIYDGGAPLTERGALISTYVKSAYFNSRRQKDSLANLGTFQQTYIGLLPQSHYNLSLYARNSNNSNNTGFVKSKSGFFTLSKPPINQPVSLTAIPKGCSVTLTWGPAKFPLAVNATQIGYALFYAAGHTPTLTESPGQKVPADIVASGKSFPLNAAAQPNFPSLTATVTNLSKDSNYHFLLVPYTWNGTDTETYNYLTEGALEVVQRPLASQLSLSIVKQKKVCDPESDYTITMKADGGMTPYYYTVGNNSYDTGGVFNIPKGTYTLGVKDKAGCIYTQPFLLQKPGPLTVKATITNNIPCNGFTNGSLQLQAVGGLQPYVYNFDGGGFDTTKRFANLKAGVYKILVKDAGSCITADSAILLQPDSLTINIDSLVNVSCSGDNTGAVQFNSEGGVQPYKYSFNNGIYTSTNLYTDLQAGNFSLYAKDAKGCVTTKNIAITQPTPVTLNITPKQVSCTDSTDGYLHIAASGGIPLYQYSFNSGAFSGDSIFNNLAAGTYTLSAKDNNGCITTETAIIANPDPLLIKNNIIRNLSCNNDNASVQFDVTGGHSPYVYSFNGAAFINTPLFDNISTTSNTITVKDASGCLAAQDLKLEKLTFQVSAFPNPAPTQFSLLVKDCVDNNPVYIKITDVYGNTVLTFSGMANSTYKLGSNLAAGIYFVQVQKGSNKQNIKLFKAK